jgi:hypothetical protein
MQNAIIDKIIKQAKLTYDYKKNVLGLSRKQIDKVFSIEKKDYEIQSTESIYDEIWEEISTTYFIPLAVHEAKKNRKTLEIRYINANKFYKKAIPLLRKMNKKSQKAKNPEDRWSLKMYQSMYARLTNFRDIVQRAAASYKELGPLAEGKTSFGSIDYEEVNRPVEAAEITSFDAWISGKRFGVDLLSGLFLLMGSMGMLYFGFQNGIISNSFWLNLWNNLKTPLFLIALGLSLFLLFIAIRFYILGAFRDLFKREKKSKKMDQ